MSLADPPAVSNRDPDLILARLHLRLGSLALARAELETLAGRDALDEAGLVDLAEVRWRTGDVVGAGDAAQAALRDDEGPLLALVIAAEAAAARGRPTESRRLADKAMAQANGTIDAVFAGMPRAAGWPPDAAAPPPSPTTMFDPPRRATSPVHRHPMPHGDAVAPIGAGAPAPARPDLAPRPDAAADAATIGLWDAGSARHEPGMARDLTPDVETSHGPDAPELPAGDAELDLGRAALEKNDPAEAAVRLGLALRVAPALAPAVLDLVRDRSEPGLVLVRGDAYRLLGHELDARRAYADAARGGGAPPSPAPEAADMALKPDQPGWSDPPQQGDPE